MCDLSLLFFFIAVALTISGRMGGRGIVVAKTTHVKIAGGCLNQSDPLSFQRVRTYLPRRKSAHD